MAGYATRGGAARFLTAAQSRAFRGVPAAPLSLIWGPPGTGKTYMLGHLLLGYVLAARQSGRPVRILVTAFTHYAINNVLNKVSDLLRGYGLSDAGTAVVKVMGNQPHAADDRLPADVARVGQQELNALLNGDTRCLIAGSTVWGVYNAMQAAGDTVQPWFDVTLIDEASQMKLPEALIAFSAAKPDGAVILAGDDRQLPPIIHGDYPDEHAHMLTSVFAYMRQRIEERALAEPGFDARTIFQLEENFRMNKPLTDYPARMLYEDRFFSQQEGIRITTDPPLPADSDDPIDFMLHPDRPVVLVRYAAPAGFTARNPLEADLAARIAARLAADPGPAPVGADEGGGMTDAGLIPHLLFAADGFAVLSPHRAQNAAIRAALAARGFGTADRPLPLVDTVDKLQGQERDVVVVSYGVADEEYAEAEAAFLLSSNRFNVATTRPRRKLIVLCSDAVLDVVPQDRDVLLEAMMLKEFRGFCDSGPRTFVWETEEFGAVTLAVQWKAFERMESTIKQIEEYRSAD
ncbi:MAG: AAA family ATPase [Candidatus Promineofilum sp.]|nr:AAA family ATPase [Promineifilum sp.]